MGEGSIKGVGVRWGREGTWSEGREGWSGGEGESQSEVEGRGKGREVKMRAGKDRVRRRRVRDEGNVKGG